MTTEYNVRVDDLMSHIPLGGLALLQRDVPGAAVRPCCDAGAAAVPAQQRRHAAADRVHASSRLHRVRPGGVSEHCVPRGGLRQVLHLVL